MLCVECGVEGDVSVEGGGVAFGCDVDVYLGVSDVVAFAAGVHSHGHVGAAGESGEDHVEGVGAEVFCAGEGRGFVEEPGVGGVGDGGCEVGALCLLWGGGAGGDAVCGVLWGVDVVGLGVDVAGGDLNIFCGHVLCNAFACVRIPHPPVWVSLWVSLLDSQEQKSPRHALIA